MKPYRVSKRLVVVLMGVIFALITGGYAFFRLQQSSLRVVAENDLLAVAQIKIDQIVSWRENQLAEGVELMSSIYLKQGMDSWIQRKDADGEDLIRTQMQALVEHYHFRDILLLTPEGRQLMSYSGDRSTLHPEMINSLNKARVELQPILSDIHKGEHFNYPHVSLTVPMFLDEDNQTNLVGYFLLVIDANDFLYPLIQSWPLPSETAETLLVQREEDAVLFLNELRHQNDTALSLRIPLTEMEIPAVKAVHGETGIVDGLDYRGIPVIAAISPVPDTEWFLISKIDQAEALAVWRTNAAFIMLMILGAIGTAGGFIGVIWQRNAKHHYQIIAEAELARRESEMRHQVTLLSVGDGVIVTDDDGRVELINPVAEKLTGWNFRQARGKLLEEVFQIINEKSRKPVQSPAVKVMQLGKVAGLANHTLLISKNGEEFPIADSGAPIRDDEGNITGVVLVFRDQTSEREAQRKLEENEIRFRSYFEASPTAITFHDANGIYLDANQAFCKMTGFSHEEVVGRKVVDFTAEEDRQDYHERVGRMKSGGDAVQRIEKKIVSKNREPIWVVGNTVLISDDQKKPLYFLSSMININDRKKAEEMLKSSEERFRQLAEGAPDGIFVQTGLEFVYMNPACVDIFGAQSEDDLVGNSMLARFEAHAHEQIMSNIQKVIQNEEPSGLIERECLTIEGKPFYAEINSVCIDWQGEPGTLVFIRDITDRKRVNDELAARENLLNEIFNVLPIGLWIADKNGKLIRSNPAGREIWGAEPLVEMDEYDVFKARRLPSGEEISADDWALAHTIESKRTIVNELLEIDTFEGKKKTILNYTTPVLDKNGDLQAAIIVNLDISDKQKVEDDLRRSEELLKKAQEVVHVGSWVWDIRSNRVEWSDEMYRIFGINQEEFDGDLTKVIENAIHPEDREAVEASNLSVAQNKKPIALEYRIIRPDGDIRTVWAEAGELVLDKQGDPLHLAGIVQDITEHKKAQQEIMELNQSLEKRVEQRTKQLEDAQEKLLRQERLAVLGRLAGSVSHELRNPLGVISNATYILGTLLKEHDEKAREYVGIIKEETNRSEKIITDMLDFSKVRVPVRERLVLNEMVAKALDRVTPDQNIEITVLFKDGLPDAYADRTNILQIFENIIKNAVQAMPAGGKLTIDGDVRRIKKKEYLVVSISDTGVGMTDEVKGKVFEPLFTTKARGIGLGLPLSKSLIETNGGSIKVESQPGLGTTFTIYIPAYKEEEK